MAATVTGAQNFNSFPQFRAVPQGALIQWSSDWSATRGGFQICGSALAPSVPPALSPAAPGGSVANVFVVTFTAVLDASIDDFDDVAYKAAMAELLDVRPSDITLNVTSGSLTVTAQIETVNQAAATHAQEVITQQNVTSLRALLGFTVESIAPPTVDVVAKTYAAPSPPPPSPPPVPPFRPPAPNNPGIAIGEDGRAVALNSGSSDGGAVAAVSVVGGIIVLSVIVAAVCIVQQRKRRGAASTIVTTISNPVACSTHVVSVASVSSTSRSAEPVELEVKGGVDEDESHI